MTNINNTGDSDIDLFLKNLEYIGFDRFLSLIDTRP